MRAIIPKIALGLRPSGRDLHVKSATAPPPSRLRRTGRRGRLALPMAVALLALSPAHADTVALWLFDEAEGAASVPGKFGKALRPGATRAGFADPPAGFRNVTASQLNLGAHDWTLECWLLLDRSAAEEGTLFEIGTGPRGASELLTRFSVLPRETAFAFVAVSTGADRNAEIGAKRIEYPNPEGPPGGVAIVRTVTLALHQASLPREAWFHVALVHTADGGELRLFIDGKVRATAAMKMNALPHGDEAYVSIGCDGSGRRVLAGAIDELRVSDHAVYAAEFAPPGSFGAQRKGAPRNEAVR